MSLGPRTTSRDGGILFNTDSLLTFPVIPDSSCSLFIAREKNH